MPFSNRMALGVLAARLVDGGGIPNKVPRGLGFRHPAPAGAFLPVESELVRPLHRPALAGPAADGSSSSHSSTGVLRGRQPAAA